MTRQANADRRRFLLLALLFLGLPILPAAGQTAQARDFAPPKRFLFKIPAETPLRDLLPLPPEMTPPIAPWLVDDLAKVPEIIFERRGLPDSEKLTRAQADSLKLTGLELDAATVKAISEKREATTKRIAHGLAKVNHLNAKGMDQFVKELLGARPDLAGLPITMGDACRLNAAASRALASEVGFVRAALEGTDKRMMAARGKGFWETHAQIILRSAHKTDERYQEPAAMAAFMQILGPASAELHLGLVQHLATIDRPEARRNLARLAVFSHDAKVRAAAVEALQSKPGPEVTEVLMQGLRYPWPAVAQNAAEAVVRLKRRDLLPRLVDLLDEDDPRAPAVQDVAGTRQPFVREVVRINHHHSCLLCHPPANTPDVMDAGAVSPKVIAGAVPSPNAPLPGPFQGYDPFTSPDILVRADVTYLRQDFSLMQPVKDAYPWPEMQRFDYVVRKRAVTGKDVEAYKAWLADQGAGYAPPHHRAAVFALRGLTGRDTTEATSKAWRPALE